MVIITLLSFGGVIYGIMELRSLQDRVRNMIEAQKSYQNQYFNLKKCDLQPTKNWVIKYFIDSIHQKYNSGTVSDSFNFINQTGNLYYKLTSSNYDYMHSCWLGMVPYSFQKHLIYDKYFFGLEDKMEVPGNFGFQMSVNGIPGANHYMSLEVPYSDTLYIELIKFTVDHDTGLIDTLKASEKIITADFLAAQPSRY